MRKLIQGVWLTGVLYVMLSLQLVQAQNGPAKPEHACGTDAFMELIEDSHHNWRDRQGFETWLARQQGTDALASLRGSVITIPVIVHVLHDGEAVGSGTNLSQTQINSQIDVLNEDFRRLLGTPGHNSSPVGADIEIEFCLATIDPNNQTLSEAGIDRVSRQSLSLSAPPYTISFTKNNILKNTIWDPNLYMNIWTVDLANDFLGFAQLPDSSTISDLGPNQGPSNTDGVVISPTAFGRTGSAAFPYDEGRTTTHEIGHWLGLRHTWGDGDCSDDDYCGDTPATGDPHYGCPNGQAACDVNEDAMIENYMEYTDDACMNVFTTCQKTRMRTVMTFSPRRASLINSTVCLGQAAPVADFSVNQREVCAGSRLQFIAQAPGATSWQWTFAGGSPSSSSQQNPQVDYLQPGTYSVSLSVSNAIGSDAESRNGWISVSDSGPNVFYVEDFEEGLSGWGIENNDLMDTWALVDVSGQASGQKAMYVNLYYYTNAGQRDGLISPPIDISRYENVSLEFDYAYRRYSASDKDSLIVYVSTDGGQTFPQRVFAGGENGNGNFATGELLTSNFVPAFSADWCHSGTGWASCPTLDLSAYNNDDELVFRFETYNDYGNNIFIDNIQLQGTCKPVQVDVEPLLEDAFSWQIFPNPGRDVLQIRYEGLANQASSLSLLDVQGRVVAQAALDASLQTGVYRWELPQITPGLYLVQLRHGTTVEYRKWVRH